MRRFLESDFGAAVAIFITTVALGLLAAGCVGAVDPTPAPLPASVTPTVGPTSAPTIAPQPSPTAEPALVWRNLSRSFVLLTADGGNVPVNLGKGGTLRVGGYVSGHLAILHIGVRFGDGATFPGRGGLYLWPVDPALREPYLAESGIGTAYVYSNRGTKEFGACLIEQLPGDPTDTANKGITFYLPRNDWFNGDYTVKAANNPNGRAWAAGDVIGCDIDVEVP